MQIDVEVDFIDGRDITRIARQIHFENRKWWVDLNTGEPIVRNKGEQIALIHAELSEALEGVRKNSMDTHLTNRKMEEAEMADALIRILDYCAGHGLDIGGAFVEKMAYNRTRADHSDEERKKEHGKKF